MKKKVKTEQEKNDRLQKFVDEYYKDAVVRIRPIYPYILVRLLPRTHQVGMIVIPETAKKVMHEGIVLETFRPFWRRMRNQHLEEKEVLVQAPAAVGSHILFEWFEGVPVEHTLFKTAYVQDQKYVLVASDPIGGGRNGVLGTVEESAAIETTLSKELTDLDCIDYGRGHRVSDIATQLLEKFLITPKDQTSATRSGALA